MILWNDELKLGYFLGRGQPECFQFVRDLRVSSFIGPGLFFPFVSLSFI